MITFPTFLETGPPDTKTYVASLASPNGQFLILNQDDLSLHCDSDHCDGKGNLHFVNYGGTTYLEPEKAKAVFVSYLCRNCQTTSKMFALVATLDGSGYSGTALKLGETPAFGPAVPSRVISLIGPDRELFLSGRRAENRGLGIGAFAYYRRVIENQKERIILEMAKVAKKLAASETDLKLFAEAAKETQFSAAIDKIKQAIPSALRIDGHDPLTLLHNALSDGLHERSDAECLECAMEIRLVLSDLAERMAQVLKEQAELKEAVNKLLARNASKKSSSSDKPEEK